MVLPVIAHVLPGLAYLLLFLVIFRYVFVLYDRGELISTRGATLLSLLICEALGTITMFGQTQPHAALFFALTFVLTGHFMTSAYLLILLYWIGAYQMKCSNQGQIVFPDMRIWFLILNTMDLIIRVTAELMISLPTASPKVHIAGAYLLLSWFAFEATGIGMGFLYVGLRIIRNLKKFTQDSKRIKSVKKMTVRTCVVSAALVIVGIESTIMASIPGQAENLGSSIGHTLFLFFLPLIMFWTVKPTTKSCITALSTSSGGSSESPHHHHQENIQQKNNGNVDSLPLQQSPSNSLSRNSLEELQTPPV